MNEKLNLVKILKDCPKGTKLYSTVYGEVKFEKIGVCVKYPIVIKLKDGRCTFTSEGKLFVDYDGDCTLFPSKEERDWSEFTAPWYKKDKLVKPKFKVGDWIITPTNKVLQITSIEGIWQYSTEGDILVVFEGGQELEMDDLSVEELIKILDNVHESFEC